jgi:hypothetical protein
MEKFLLSEMYRLELHWDKVIYEIDGVCKLTNAIFSGPAISIANAVNPNDHIMVDFYKQYIILVKNVYVAKLSWGNIKYNKDNSISLNDCFLKHDTELNRVPKLKDNDFIVIDTKNHEEAVHAFNLVYTSYVINETGVLYKF